MAERVDIDLALKRISDLEKVLKLLTSSSSETDKLVKSIGKMDNLMSSLANSTKKYQTAIAQSSGRGLGQTGQMLAKGDPASFLTNSATSGQIKNFEASLNQVFARLTNRFAKGMNDVVKSVQNQDLLAMAKTRQVSPSANLAELNLQIKAQEARAAAAKLDRNRFTGPLNAYDAEITALKNLQVARLEILASEKQSEQVEKRLLTLQEKLTASTQQYRIAKLASGGVDTGNARAVQADQLARAALLVEKQRLIVDRERLASAGQYTLSLQRQEARLASMLQMENRIKDANKGKIAQANRDQNVERVTGDAGASLFKIQAALMVNYTLMNQIFNAFRFGTQFVVEYDKAMHDLSAIVEITNTEMKGLSETFIEISQNTKFSAVEIANAATTMGQAGFSAREIQDSIGAVALFATATGEDLASAVDLSTSAITVFNLNASEMGNVANTLTGAINLSKLTVDKLSYGIQYAGNTAAEAGITLNELVSVLGAMSNAGIKSGSTLGTGLRQMIVELETPSKKFREELKKVGLSVLDVDVKSRGLVPVLNTLREAGFNSASAFKAFEIRAASAFLAASRNVEVAEELQTKLVLTNAAAEANAKQMNSMANAAARASNVLGASFVGAAEPMQKAIVGLLNGTSSLFTALNDIKGLMPTLGVAFTSIFGGIALTQIGKLIANLSSVGGVITAFKTPVAGATIAARGFGTALAVLATPLGLITGAIALVTVGFLAFTNEASNAAERMDELTAAMNKSQGDLDATKNRIESVDTELTRLNGRYAEFGGNSQAVRNEVLQMQIKFGEFSDELGSGALSTVEDLIRALRELRGEMSKTAADQAALVISKQALTFREGVRQLQTNFSDAQRDSAQGSGLSSSYKSPQSVIGANATYSKNSGQLGELLNLDLNNASKAELDSAGKRLSMLRGELMGAARNVNKEALALEEAAASGKKISEMQLNDAKARAKDLDQSIALVMKQEQYVASTAELKRTQTTQAVESTAAIQKYRADLGELDKQQSVAAEKLRQAKTKGQKQEILATMKKLQTQSESMITKGTSEALASEVANELGKTKDDVSLAVASVATVAAEATNNARQTIGNVTDELSTKTKEHFDAITELQKLGIEKVKRAIDQATDGIDRQIADIDSTIGQATDTERGGLRGRYSDVEISMMQDKKNDLQTDRVKTRADAIKESLPAFDMMVDRQKQLYEASVASFNADKNNAEKLRAMIATEKDYNSALNDRRALMNEMADLQTELTARTGEEAEAHKTLGEQLEYAVSKYQEQFRLQNDFGLNLQRNVTSVLDGANTAFSDFVKSVATGTQSVGSAFKAMAAKIIESMLDIAAQQAAAGLMSGLGSLLTSAIGGAMGGVDMSTHAAAPITGVSVRNLPALAARGKYIRAASGTAVTTRDSVPILAQPGEFLLRKSAVDMIGRENLETMNANGNRQLSQGGSAIAASQAAAGESKTPINIWVVTPDQQTGLTERDVIATVGENISRGGSLKKLIKQVNV